jgi:co-chaperonin GroES (HSP10)
MVNFKGSEITGVNRLSIFIVATISVLSLSFSAAGQTPGASPSTPAVASVIGEVKAIDATANQMVVRADNGTLFTVTFSDKTQYMRVAPGETSLAKATKITMADVGAGDRVLARGRGSAEQKTVPALQVVVMSKADLAKKQEQDRAEWRRRGVSGIVGSLNPSTREITVSSRTLAGLPQSVVIPVTDKVLMRRYPPDTIPKYSEARASKFEEVKVGDQLRALGDKSADGSHLTAEEVLFGTFRIAGGTVTAIDPATNQIKISDLQTKKPLTIILKPESVLRRYPQGGMFGGGMGPGGPGGRGAGNGAAGPGTGQAAGPGAGQGQPRPPGAGPGGPGGPQGGGPGRGGGNMADLLERLPIISINDLKVGDTIIMSSLQGADPSQLTAISLVTGVETLLTMMAARPQTGGQPARGQGVDLNGSFGGMFGGAGAP